MWISILELNELGEYAAVELHQAKDVNTGGVFQLRQVRSFCVCVFFTLRVSRRTPILLYFYSQMISLVSFLCPHPHLWRLLCLHACRVTPAECRSQ